MNEIVPNTINGTGTLNIRVKDGGTTITASNYRGGGVYYQSSATATDFYVTTAIRISSTSLYGNSLQRQAAIIDFTYDNTSTRWSGFWTGLKSGAGSSYGTSMGRIVITSFDGIQLWSPDVNLTANGTIYVYGMKNS
jgi:hypothetical protein